MAATLRVIVAGLMARDASKARNAATVSPFAGSSAIFRSLHQVRNISKSVR
jgi:hypothetical protein